MWPNYSQDREFRLPGIDQSFAVFDLISDGRVISSDGSTVSLESTVGSGQFLSILQGLNGYSPFIRVNRNDHVACADGNEIRFFDLATPANYVTESIAGYDAEWHDDQNLAVTVPGKVVWLDRANQQFQDVVTGIGGASAGVTFDAEGNLYTGNGLDTDTGQQSPSVTGTIKYFNASEVANAINSNSPLDFEQHGIRVCELLSAAYLGFDCQGDLHIAGADPSGSDFGFAALVRGSALQAAINGGPVIDDQSPASIVHRFDPDNAANNFYYVNSNLVTKELYFSDFNKQRVFVYK